MNAPTTTSRSRTRLAFYAAILLSVTTISLAAQSPTPAAASTAPVASKGWVGSWVGALEVNSNVKLRLALDVTESDGKLAAILNSIDQNSKVPVTAISAAGDKGAFACAAIGGSFEGRFSVDGSEIVGTWSQGPNTLPLTLKRQSAKS